MITQQNPNNNIPTTWKVTKNKIALKTRIARENNALFELPQGQDDGGRRAHPMRNRMSCMGVTCFPFFRTFADGSEFSIHQAMKHGFQDK
jgi:hypothetical protein